MKNNLQIAIDGPVASGKSTMAAKLAARLGILYVDTGAMYRTAALAAKLHGVDWKSEQAVANLVAEVEIEFQSPNGDERDGRKVTVLLDGEDVSAKIRSLEIGEGASVVSQYARVRDNLVAKQQAIAARKSVVMEGRDIGGRVLPEADLKIYMDAGLEVRVARRMKQLESLGEQATWEQVMADVVQRDTREMTRKVDPLRPSPGAWILDTSYLTIEEVIDTIYVRVSKLRK